MEYVVLKKIPKIFLYVLDYEARLKEYNELNRWVNNQRIVQQGI